MSSPISSSQTSPQVPLWTLEQVAQQLGLSPKALARLCVRFRLPTQAYDRMSASQGTVISALPSLDNVDNCFTESDIQALHHIQRRILGGESLETIARDWFRHQKLSAQSALPKGSTFAQVLNHRHTRATQVTSTIPETPPAITKAHPRATKPAAEIASTASALSQSPAAPPSPKVFQQLAQHLSSSAAAENPPAPSSATWEQTPTAPRKPAPTEGLNALFSPSYSPTIGLAKLPDLSEGAVFRKARRWPEQQMASAAYTPPQHATPAQPQGLTKAFLSALRNH